ncbi:MAG: hypothetical protein IPJ49_29495 [Candidatus Obscuribacter sp.]|nr:hypothetical protein [Candidatus Obscuribacter sp.]
MNKSRACRLRKTSNLLRKFLTETGKILLGHHRLQPQNHRMITRVIKRARPLTTAP